MLAKKSDVISKLSANFTNPLLVGKSEKGSILAYNIPNSPTRVESVDIKHRSVLHRTEAGAGGIISVNQPGGGIILAASFVNAGATAKYIKALPNAKVTIIPMGHEGTNPSLEDNICAEYIKALINGKKINLAKFLPVIKNDSGKYFFSRDQWQYPKEDFFKCLEIDHFDFIIKANVIDDYAILTCVN